MANQLTPIERRRAAIEADAPRRAHRAAINTKLSDALGANQAYLDLPTPTAAQTTAHCKRMARQLSGLIRLQLGELGDTSGT